MISLSYVTENIPALLRERPQWVAWKVEVRNGRDTKVPIDSHTGHYAAVNDPRSWGDFGNVHQFCTERGLGIAYVFSGTDGLYGVDLDECMASDGHPCDHAQAIIDTLNTYAEVSPSGKGVKVIGIGRKPVGSTCRTKNVDGFKELECYDGGRYFTITGRILDGAPRNPAPDDGALALLCNDLLKPTAIERAERSEPTRPVTEDDSALLQRIIGSKQGPKFQRLYNGNTADLGSDHSAADLSLCVMLAWWTQRDEARIDSMFRNSLLYREQKWNKKHFADGRTYGQATVQKAIALCPDCYQPYESVNWRPVYEAIKQASNRLKQLLTDTFEGRRRPVQWPWRMVHTLTRALVPETVTILCGSPGASKSFMVMQAMTWWHRKGIHAEALMIEDSAGYHLRRSLAQVCKDQRITDEEWIEANQEHVAALYAKHEAFYATFEPRIFEPPKDRDVDDVWVLGWLEERAAAGARVLVIDPITLIDSGEKQWVADRRIMAGIKRVAERKKVSVVVVTHPKADNAHPHLDNVAGGKAVVRAAQTVVWLEYLDEDESVIVLGKPGDLPGQAWVNRKLHVLKSRNGRGQSKQIGLQFEGASLTFKESGVITTAKDVRMEAMT